MVSQKDIGSRSDNQSMFLLKEYLSSDALKYREKDDDALEELIATNT